MSPASNSFFVEGTESLIDSPIIVKPGMAMRITPVETRPPM